MILSPAAESAAPAIRRSAAAGTPSNASRQPLFTCVLTIPSSGRPPLILYHPTKFTLRHARRASRNIAMYRGQPSGVRSNGGIKAVTNMSELRYPNESRQYREARDALLKDEKRACRQSQIGGGKAPRSPSRRAVERGLRLPMGERRESREQREILRAVWDKNTLLLYSFMYGPNWDNPCPSCTSLVDGFDRSWYQVTQNAAFVAIAKAPADKINTWAKKRGWSQIALVSGSDSPYQADYKCQGDSEDMQWPVMHVFKRQNGRIFHFWGTELSGNHVDTVWPYWNSWTLRQRVGQTFPRRHKNSGPNSWRKYLKKK